MKKGLKALVCSDEGGVYVQNVFEHSLDFLQDNEVCIRVHYSSLNYKDMLSARGMNRVTKNYPHITGIDAAGVIVSDKTNQFAQGDEVIVSGYDLGMNTFGGHASHIKVPVSWVIHKPPMLSLRESMIIGTAGFGVALAWFKMQPYLDRLQQGEILVTGASGGVGMLALILLDIHNMNVVACSSKVDKHKHLKDLGATRVLTPEDILIDSKKPLSTPKWFGAIDNLGGNYLSSILSSAHKEACIVSIGLTASMQLQTTILPFIINGVNLIGINAADTTRKIRQLTWGEIAKLKDILIHKIENHIEEIRLEQIPQMMQKMYEGTLSGRVLININ